MLFMIIENFHQGKIKLLYKRLEEKGRQLPENVQYIDSWINEELTTCYQLMESISIQKINEWINHWKDLADFCIIPVITSAEARKKAEADSEAL